MQGPERDDMELMRIRLIPLVAGRQHTVKRKCKRLTHIFAAARVHPAQGIHQSVALIERGAILRVVLVNV